mgnify:CR=1 FL=1
MDKSTPNLLQYGCSGKHFPSAELVGPQGRGQAARVLAADDARTC